MSDNTDDLMPIDPTKIGEAMGELPTFENVDAHLAMLGHEGGVPPEIASQLKADAAPAEPKVYKTTLHGEEIEIPEERLPQYLQLAMEAEKRIQAAEEASRAYQERLEDVGWLAEFGKTLDTHPESDKFVEHIQAIMGGKIRPWAESHPTPHVPSPPQPATSQQPGTPPKPEAPASTQLPPELLKTLQELGSVTKTVGEQMAEINAWKQQQEQARAHAEAQRRAQALRQEAYQAVLADPVLSKAKDHQWATDQVILTMKSLGKTDPQIAAQYYSRKAGAIAEHARQQAREEARREYEAKAAAQEQARQRREADFGDYYDAQTQSFSRPAPLEVTQPNSTEKNFHTVERSDFTEHALSQLRAQGIIN